MLDRCGEGPRGSRKGSFMTLGSFLYQLCLAPLMLLMETIFGVFVVLTRHVGLAIFPLSLVLNFLLLPFYLRADTIQRQEQERQKAMEKGLAHIRKTFRGDERYMMIQTYYRQNNYKPIYALRSALPLLLQVPFFIAAYRLLSDLPAMTYAKFYAIPALGSPDGMLKLGSLTLNLLPILMTAINILSSEIYAKGMPLKDKLKLHAMALIFLVLLYRSPAGLVLYWTLNNLFSLCKNIITTAKNKRRALCIVTLLVGGLDLWYTFTDGRNTKMRFLTFLAIGMLFLLPTAWQLLRAVWKPRPRRTSSEGADRSLYLYAAIFCTLFAGGLIPSAVIGSSPEEFVVLTNFHSPLLYVLYSLLLAAGVFLIWLGLFYYLADEQGRGLFGAGMWLLCGVAVTDYLFFGTRMGNLSRELLYDSGVGFSLREMLLNAGVLAALCALLLLVWWKRRKLVKAAYPVLILAVFAMTAWNCVGIQRSVPHIKSVIARQEEQGELDHLFTLSKKGRNVIVLMLDRAIDGFVPYIFRERPELESQFDGFTWYPNTLSYGPSTNVGTPPLFGGYEYRPEEVNRRSDERLADKHNEALQVMPAMFDREGFQVSVCDPPYAGYGWVSDLSIYEGYENVQAHYTASFKGGDDGLDATELEQIWKRNLFCFSIMKSSPLALQHLLYMDGTYFDSERKNGAFVMDAKYNASGRSKSVGIPNDFLADWKTLTSLSAMTEISGQEKNTFFMADFNATHDNTLLQEPSYEPMMDVDNTEYDAGHEERFILDGRRLTADNFQQMSHYQVNMATFLQLGKWFDYLRSEGVYDNTRIILVADHGYNTNSFSDMLIVPEGDSGTLDIMWFNPLLMVKDFGDTGFKQDDRFMTNADVPTLACEGVLEDMRNPFSGKLISSEAKNEPEQHVFFTRLWNVMTNNGNTFLPGSWYSLSGQNIFDAAGWKKLGDY